MTHVRKKVNSVLMQTSLSAIFSLILATIFLSYGFEQAETYQSLFLLIGIVFTCISGINIVWFLPIFLFRNNFTLLIQEPYELAKIKFGIEPTTIISENGKIVGRLYWGVGNPNDPYIEIDMKIPATYFEKKNQIVGDMSYPVDIKLPKSLVNVHTEYRIDRSKIISPIDIDLTKKHNENPIYFLFNLKNQIEELPSSILDNNEKISDEDLRYNEYMPVYLCLKCNDLILTRNKKTICEATESKHETIKLFLDARSPPETARNFSYVLVLSFVAILILINVFIDISLLHFMIINFTGLIMLFYFVHILHKISAAKNADRHFNAKRDYILTQL